MKSQTQWNFFFFLWGRNEKLTSERMNRVYDWVMYSNLRKCDAMLSLVFFHSFIILSFVKDSRISEIVFIRWELKYCETFAIYCRIKKSIGLRMMACNLSERCRNVNMHVNVDVNVKIYLQRCSSSTSERQPICLNKNNFDGT